MNSAITKVDTPARPYPVWPYSPDDAHFAALMAPIVPDEAKAAREVAEWAKTRHILLGFKHNFRPQRFRRPQPRPAGRQSLVHLPLHHYKLFWHDRNVSFCSLQRDRLDS